MPGFNRTGPRGMGPMTGRGFGPCGGGMGRGRGMGFGRGMGPMAFQSVGFTPEEEKKILKAELEQLEEEKKQIENKLKDMK